ncbi:hypothetical protein [Mucilaginibacter agri]|uniref:Lipoprotein n=1 Tax=Mucilaginibacter agri TaxID=2695265 RepID=A0A965ZDW7_9SPHI|nr:hypothetical protein [Mucilaginibacter agri]NCD69258.1 hypothetical protein [Mucilaginibacter agri]
MIAKINLSISSLILIGLIACGNVRKKGKLIIKYEYSTLTMNGDSYKYKLYFIVDSSKTLTYEKTKFFQFTFSSDSLEKSGYLCYNDKTKNLNFIPLEYEKNKMFIPVGKIQTFPLFSERVSEKIYQFGDLGSNFRTSSIKLTSNKDFTYEVKIITQFRVSDKSFIDKMYYTDLIYPKAITFFDPFLKNGYVTVQAKVLSK